MISTRLQSLSPEIAQYEHGVPLDKIVPTSARRAGANFAGGAMRGAGCIDVFE